MTSKLTRLELTWPGKEDRFNPEPRILIEDKEKSFSYEPTEKGAVEPTYDNMLIHGDNLLALKALEQDYTGKVKCIYIDPPFNTGNAFDNYEDGLEHSIWLSLMRDRIEILRRLLSEDGSIFIHLDDNELDYAKVLLDEIFGRKNFVNRITIDARSPSAFSTVNPGVFKSSEYILWFAKNKNIFHENTIKIPRTPDLAYNKWIDNPQDDYKQWRFMSLKEAYKQYTKSQEIDTNRFYDFILSHANQIFRYTAISNTGAGKETLSLKEKSKQNPSEIFCLERKEGLDNQYIHNGQQISFYSKNVMTIDGSLCATTLLTNIWIDIAWEGIANEGGVQFKKGKKPEKLIRRVLQLSTNPGDLVLDSFLGSGTTAAVAHKMGRRWIGVEMGDHVYTHCLPRLQKVIKGEDAGGVTKATSWTCGGGFKFYELASSLIIKDKYGQQIISDKYNADMLAEAMCKVLGYHYKPDTEKYWKQGYSSEKSFIYTTTMAMQETSLEKIASEIGDNNLLICCSAFIGNSSAYPNITVKKIPSAILKKCEWGREGYPLNLKDYHPSEEEFEFDEESEG